MAQNRRLVAVGNAAASMTIDGRAFGIGATTTGGVEIGALGSTTSDLTVAARVLPRSGFGTPRYFVAAAGDWQLTSESGITFLFNTFNTSQYDQAYESGDLQALRIQTGMGVFRNGTGIVVYRGGRRVASGGPTTRRANGATQITMLNSATTVATNSARADISVAGVWYRAFSDAEAFSWSENPWQILSPLRPIIYSFSSASAAPALSAATVVDITSTSARPRVTVTF